MRDYDSPEFKARLDLLREKINAKYSLYPLVVQYNPQATPYMNKMISILNPMDSNPSFLITYRGSAGDIWHCFSTGKGGGYLELLYWLKKLRENENVNYATLANNILLSDVSLQLLVGFKSLFIEVMPTKVTSELRTTEFSRESVMSASRQRSLRSLINELAAKEDKSLLLAAFSDYEKNTPKKDLIAKYVAYSKNDISPDSKELLDLIAALKIPEEN